MAQNGHIGTIKSHNFEKKDKIQQKKNSSNNRHSIMAQNCHIGTVKSHNFHKKDKIQQKKNLSKNVLTTQ